MRGCGLLLDSTPFAVIAHHCAGILSSGADKATSSDTWVIAPAGGGFLAFMGLCLWWCNRHGPDDSGEDGGSYGGSAGPPPDPPPPPDLPRDGPSWWPEFEQEFAAYVERAREKESARLANGRASRNP